MQSDWPRRGAPPELAPGAIHLWAAPLERPPDVVQGMRATLADDERDRAARFHFERHATRYIVGRGTLRLLLASYLRLRDPRDVVFGYGAHGKPVLAVSSGGAAPLQFNLAHSEAFGLFAFTRSIEIGVDVEHIHFIPDMESVMKVSFADAERREVIALGTAEERRDAFFRCWTRKEAVLKALGWGLARPLDSFEVSLDLDRPGVRSMNDNPRAATEWRLLHLTPAPGFVGAAGWQGGDLSPECFAYPA